MFKYFCQDQSNTAQDFQRIQETRPKLYFYTLLNGKPYMVNRVFHITTFSKFSLQTLPTMTIDIKSALISF